MHVPRLVAVPLAGCNVALTRRTQPNNQQTNKPTDQSPTADLVLSLQDAAVWMKTASRYHATHICAPNFGFALAARKTKDKVRDTLDLSSLRQAICAAEPIRKGFATSAPIVQTAIS